MEVLVPAPVVREVDVGEPVSEGLQEACRSGSCHPSPRLRFACPTSRWKRRIGSASSTAWRSSTSEKLRSRFSTMIVIPRGAASCASCAIASAFILRIWSLLCSGTRWSGWTLTSSTPAVGERVEGPPVEVAADLAEICEGRGQREVPGGVADDPEAQIGTQSPDLLAVRKPRCRGLDREVEEVESILRDAMDLLLDGASREVHRTNEHRPILTRPRR